MWHSLFNLPCRFMQHLQHRLQGAAQPRVQLPMAIMLDETQAYKPEHQPSHQPHTAVLQPTLQTDHNAPRNTASTSNRAFHSKPVRAIHQVLRGTPAQICNELDALVAQEALCEKRV